MMSVESRMPGYDNDGGAQRQPKETALAQLGGGASAQ
jgi:hypothetical protein